MATALDYSSGYPAATAILDAGHAGVIRYVGTPGRAKNINAPEYADLTAHGVGVALVYEDHAGDSLGGYPAGQRAARLARADADAIGFPSSRPIYFAIDSDQITATDFDLAMAYLDGAAAILGHHRVGVYGEADIIDRAVPAHAEFGWQTSAWSRGRRSGRAHLFQQPGQIWVGGIECDVSEILADDWGQHDGTGHPGAETRFLDDEESALLLLSGANRSASFDIPAGATQLRVNCPVGFIIVHGIWQAGEGIPEGDRFDYKWSHESDFQVDRLRPWKIDVVPGATQGSIIYSYSPEHPERTASLSFR
ncbi:glycoside hydrolase domain-containing protein [Amycolatopsis sp. NPDC059021]|uniref:glycoside hydrolase domain-containing protein n=1 Tax=Amycolatopsis sp. NPDC059021 TaxID=3346704 RepID=UPI00366CAAE6